MHFSVFIMLCILLRLEILRASHDCDNNYNKYYSSSGDIHIVGLFDAHRDANCTIPNPLILQQMYNIAVTVKILNNIGYIPGLTIGMSLYDTCSAKEITAKSIISSIMDENCIASYNLGIFVSRSVRDAIEEFSNSSNIPLYSLDYSPNLDTLMQISVQLLMELNYSSIDLAVFPNSDLLQQFNKLTVSQNICVKRSYTFSQYNGSCPGNNLVIIIAVTSLELSPLLKMEMDCMSTFIIVILDNNVDLTSITEHLLLHEAYIIISSNIWPEFAIAVEDDFQTIVTSIQENLCYSNVTTDFIRTASVIISVVDHLKRRLQKECGFDSVYSLCSNLTKFQKSDEPVTSNEKYVLLVPEIFGIEKRNILQYLILKSHFNVVDNYGEIKISENDMRIEFANPVFPKEVTECDLDSDRCRNCSNFVKFKNTGARLVNLFDGVSLAFRPNGWVASVLTVCVIGIVSCLCVFIFILIRVLKQDILEGNPCFTFLLIVATVLTYMAVFPFCLQDNVNSNMLCMLKLFGSSISYCFIFSVILSRILMILTCDYSGSFMSHINGYLQSFLCFFMFTVQLGMILEFWIFEWFLSHVDYCAKFVNNFFLAYLLYDAFLLIFIASVVPFVTRSRRNYREGLYFTILSGCFILTWITWSLSFFMVSIEMKDFCIAAGLTATATAVVICVLIPRTYLIVTGIVRERITSAIPSNISNLVDMNYHSTQALYDSVKLDAAIKQGELNIGYYDDPRNSSYIVEGTEEIKKRCAEVTVHNSESNYDSCSLPDAEHKTTKF